MKLASIIFMNKKDNQDIAKGKGFGFWSRGAIYMMRCFDCGKENYAAMVSSGICAWCGHDANKPEVKSNAN